MDGALSDDCGTNNHEQYDIVNEQHACFVPEIDTIQELGKAFHDILLVKDRNLESSSNLPSDDDDDGSNCSSSLEDKITGSGDSDLDQEGSTVTSIESSKPVSAFKGSREKEGVPPRKLSVSWAPDVYDPPPTSLSHYPKKKFQQQSKSNKKHGKGKQKGKVMRGGGSGPKEKKHYRKVGGRSDSRCLDSFADTDKVLTSKNYNSSVGLLDFDDDIDIGCPDSNHGSSFVEASGTMHRVR